MLTLGEELGYPENITKEIVQYYRDEMLLEHTFSGGGIEITVSGIDYVEDLIHNSPEVKTVKSNRDSVLVELYKGRQSYYGIDMHELSKRLDIPNDSAIFDIIYYLEKKQLLALHCSNAKITTNGIDYVEHHLLHS